MSAAISDNAEFNQMLMRAGWTPPRPNGPLSNEQCDAVLAQFSPNELDAFRDAPLTFRTFIDEMLPQLQAHIGQRIAAATAPLLQRIAELEARPVVALKYTGIWKPGIYRENELCTYDGSLFVAARHTTEKEQPADGSGAFILCAKRGRDAKLPKDVYEAVQQVKRLVADEKHR